jgi:hypothetical protein
MEQKPHTNTRKT